ncbi:MAG: hypothetical protein P8R04_03050, partial [Gammaproteobacteria bacterium]|nr:hypothetical protein [Gammaproteobacteria bacterium]
MIRKILFACIFALVIFILLEFSYRLVVVGPGALNIFNSKALRSYMTLMSSPYIKSSEYPEVYFELKPDLDVLLRGVSLRTNSSGLADKEYAVEKPANTYRIAVVGSSWTMPGSVPLEASYHFVLEDELNARGSDMNFEVINFGVEQYGLGEMVGTIRHRVKDYQPDMILM